MLMTDESKRSPPSSASTHQEISSEELLRGAKELWIRHGEEVYRLRLTRSGKLILQK
jgi:hemin uptake protein HemP